MPVQVPLALTEGEAKGLRQTAEFKARGTGYQAIQKTKPQVRACAPAAACCSAHCPQLPNRQSWLAPGSLCVLPLVCTLSKTCLGAQTLGYALNDSPVGLAAWITEKFHAWTDCEGDLENCVTKDELLCNICIYWCAAALGCCASELVQRMADLLPAGCMERRAAPATRFAAGLYLFGATAAAAPQWQCLPQVQRKHHLLHAPVPRKHGLAAEHAAAACVPGALPPSSVCRSARVRRSQLWVRQLSGAALCAAER